MSRIFEFVEPAPTRGERPLVAVLAVLCLIALPCCKEESSFGDARPPDGTPWNYDGPAQGDIYVNPCAPGPPPSISGKVYAPNGVDPVAGAAVHVPVGVHAIPTSVQCETCVVQGKFLAHTYAAADGSFKLVGVPHEKTYKVGIQKGYFRRFVEVTVPRCGQVTLTRDKTTLPGKNKQWGPFDSIPNIAVVTGAWDKMEKVLTKLGVQEMKTYNGKDYGTGPESIQNLLQNGGLLKSHHILLINCGTKFESLVTSMGPARNNLQSYVKEGGRLFVTDFSYDFIEQVFPQYIDFHASDSTPVNTPEEHNAAEMGSQNLVVQGDILDSSLKSWLALPEIKALQTNQKVKIEGFMTGWAVIEKASKNPVTKVWVTAPVTWAGGKGTRPLTTSFEFFDSDNKGCGRVMFSSYHTYGTSTNLLPQERILEYLLLEIGTCIDIK